MTGKTLYLPSTPLNLLLSLVLAEHFKSEQDARLILIDQRKVKDNPYHELLTSWKQSPFKQVNILAGQAKGSQKIAERRENFAWLSHYLHKWQPQHIAVGSDRRIEFQYAMALLQTRYQPAIGHYLDDGLYSYAGKKVSRLTAKINGFLHRRVYGAWWQEPSTIGASSWIQEAWLLHPELAINELQQKQTHLIETEWFQTSSVRHFSQLAWSKLAKTDKLPAMDQLLFLPHPHNAKKIRGYEAKTRAKIEQWISNGQKVGIKYHPRVGDEDPWNFSQMTGVSLLPSALATELLLPLLPNQVKITGDVGTALLTAHWLRPDLSVVAQLSNEDKFQKSFIPLMERMGVPVEDLQT